MDTGASFVFILYLYAAHVREGKHGGKTSLVPLPYRPLALAEGHWPNVAATESVHAFLHPAAFAGHSPHPGHGHGPSGSDGVSGAAVGGGQKTNIYIYIYIYITGASR